MNTLKRFLPPIVVEFLLRLGAGGNKFKYGYKSWEEAQSLCTGYSSDSITESVVESSRAVRDGIATYERDGVLFDRIQISWPLLASLLGTPRESDVLRVLDWGGSLGSTYRQNLELINRSGLKVEWTVLEQSHIAEIGNEEFQTDSLRFVSSTDSITGSNFDVVIFASSLCYLDSPQDAIREVHKLEPKRVVIDRTPVSKSGKDLIGVQKSGGALYKASYPIHVFAHGSIQQMMRPGFDLVEEWISEFQPDPQAIYKGYVFQNVHYKNKTNSSKE